MQNLTLPPILTVGEVAELMRVDPKTVARWNTDGRLPAFRTAGGHRRFYAEDVQALMQRGPAAQS